MKCPYKHKRDCKEVDTSGMTMRECPECDWYNKGIRETGSTPILDKLRKVLDKF